MKYSWSQKLFLQINKTLGSNRTLDVFMKFCAEKLIFLFIVVIFVWLALSSDRQMFYFSFVLGSGTLAVIVLNWILGLALRKPRPVKELKKIKTLTNTHQTFKSFPSDHTAIAFTLALIVVLIGIPLWLDITFLAIATLISISRVYVGVHYPRDILGGMATAGLMALSAVWITEHVTLPIFVRMFG